MALWLLKLVNTRAASDAVSGIFVRRSNNPKLFHLGYDYVVVNLQACASWDLSPTFILYAIIIWL